MKKRSVIFVAVLCVTALLLQGCSIFGLGALVGAELSATEIYYMYCNSVVEIRTEAEGGGATGSGFFCDKNGTVITNYDVIENYATAKVYLLNGEEYEVKSVKGYDMKKDIAVLETACTDSVPLSGIGLRQCRVPSALSFHRHVYRCQPGGICLQNQDLLCLRRYGYPGHRNTQHQHQRTQKTQNAFQSNPLISKAFAIHYT